jgi:methyl-accepting chemotaxis protein
MALIRRQVSGEMTQTIDIAKIPPTTASGESSGKMKSVKTLLLWSFLAIALVTIGVSCVLVTHLASGPPWTEAYAADRSMIFYSALRWRILLGAALIITAAGSVFFLLNRMIANPLEKAATVAERMAEGNLAITIPADLPKEISRIGESVNGLAVNFQEALILVWNQTENAIACIRRSTQDMSPDAAASVSPKLMADLTSARQDLESMQMMVRSFDLYDVTINDSDVLTAKDGAGAQN